MEVVKDLGILESKSEDTYAIEGIASIEMVDRDGDVILLDNMDLSGFKKNPTLFLQHNTWELGSGAGVVTDIWVGLDPEGRKALYFKAELDKDDENVQKVYAKLKKGIARGISIGFTPVKYVANEHGGYDVTESILNEISIVNVGANQGAYVTSVKSLVKDNASIAMSSKENSKSIVPSSDANNQMIVKLSEADAKLIAQEVVKLLELKEQEKSEVQEKSAEEIPDDVFEFNGEYVRIIK